MNEDMKHIIQEEIKDFAPRLASMEKTNPFDLPEGYFQNLNSEVLDSLGQTPPSASDVPEGYFQNLSENVLKKIQEEEESAKVVPLFGRRWLGIAASMILLLGAGFLISKASYSEGETTQFALDIEADEALEYLLQNDELQLSELMSLEIVEEEDIPVDDDIYPELDDEELDDILDQLNPEELEQLL